MLALVLLAALGFSDPTISWEAAPRGQQHPFEAVALSWSGATEGELRVRASADGIEWSEWIAAAIDHDMTDPDTQRYFSSIVHFGSAQRFIETSAGDVTVTLFAPPERRTRLRAETYPMGELQIRSRTDWGCPDGQGSRWTPAYTTVTHAIVHHTAGSNSVADWEAEMRNIWSFHTITRGWGDIGYNFLIDPNGVVYEGRAGGDRAIGAHFSCRNTNTVGVSLMGDFTSVQPTQAALTSLRKLLEELMRRHALDPKGTALHVPSRLTLPRIASHRDGNPGVALQTTCTWTECPGNALYALLPQLREAVVPYPPPGPRRRVVRSH